MILKPLLLLAFCTFAKVQYAFADDVPQQVIENIEVYEDPNGDGVSQVVISEGDVKQYSYRTKKSHPEDPFPDDGFDWPTIYEEADDMLDASLLMYPIASLRQLAKDSPELFGEDDAKEILKEPNTIRAIDTVIDKHAEVLRKHLEPSAYRVMNDALDAIVDRQDAAGSKHRATLLQVGDDNSKQELVYAILVDSALQRIIVSFRGSTTTKDFIMDAQLWIQTIKNPFSETKNQAKKLGIHNGFHDYLFYESTSTKEGEDVQIKYEVIINQVVEVLNNNPGFKLYVTGHSLGGALSNLFAFMASSRHDIPKPVTCVSVASPYVGDRRYRAAFRLSERKGNLRHLRVANKKDIVTLLPFISIKLSPYKHTGVELKLNRDRHQLIYPKCGWRFISNILKRTWQNSLFSNPSLKYLTNHGCKEYNKRLDIDKEYLDTVFLNDFYADNKFIGDLKKISDELGKEL